MNSHPKFKLPADILNSFTTDGYVSVRPLYDGDQMRELNSEVERFIQDVVPTMPQEQVYYEDKSDMSTLKQLQKMFEYDDYFRDLMENGLPRRIGVDCLLETRDSFIMEIGETPNKPAIKPKLSIG
jgi:phytanoyl-CoA hydroxylase